MTRFPQPQIGQRDWYSYEAIRQLPRLILMVDKNRLSPTYGCFDREYWHYRTVDFPCAMNQEFGLPLALAYSQPFPNNPYYQSLRVKELSEAAIHFAIKATHSDGSCDDYYPFEKALGAHVFSTYAMTESYLVLDLSEERYLDFFRLRGDWLLHHNETGQLANHQAFAALALYNIFLLTGEDKFLKGSNAFRDLTLSWQHEEGWFQEYEGADPGYHSCSISFLSKLYQKSKDESLCQPITLAIEFAANFMHPDGSYGGEYGSRNTYHFYPHGFEVFAERVPEAHWIAQIYLSKSLPNRTRYYNDDNRMCGHYVYDWMHAWLDWRPRSSDINDAPQPMTGTKWFPGAKLYSQRTDKSHIIVSLAKGGVFKAYVLQGCQASDTGLMIRTKQDEVFVSHHVDDYQIKVDLETSTLSVAGSMNRRRVAYSSPLRQIVFRLLNLTLARLSPNLLRSIIQNLFITGKAQSSCQFRRELKLSDEEMVVTDYLTPNDIQIKQAMIGSDATTIYVANSNVYQDSVLLPWKELDVSSLQEAQTSEVLLDRRTISLQES